MHFRRNSNCLRQAPLPVMRGRWPGQEHSTWKPSKILNRHVRPDSTNGASYRVLIWTPLLNAICIYAKATFFPTGLVAHFCEFRKARRSNQLGPVLGHSPEVGQNLGAIDSEPDSSLTHRHDLQTVKFCQRHLALVGGGCKNRRLCIRYCTAARSARSAASCCAHSWWEREHPVIKKHWLFVIPTTRDYRLYLS